MRHLAAIIITFVLVACSQPKPDVVVHEADHAPPNLSEWGVVFAKQGRLELNDGVTPYDLNSPLFSDYALKLRTVWMPEGTSAEFDGTGELDFPVGTIISKTFHYAKAHNWSADNFSVLKGVPPVELEPGGHLDLEQYALVETRLLVRYADGWRGFPYVWDAAQSDATLEIAGDFRAIELLAESSSQDITYVVPDSNQCGACHTPDHSAGELRPLGPKAWQLNRPYKWWGSSEGQLASWAAHDLLRGVPDALPAWATTPEQKVRAYLDANCAHCHNAAGAADTSALHLDIDAPLNRHFGICKSPVAVGRGSGNRPYDIYPGRPDDSILVYRMQHSDPAIAMPELGRSAVHEEGVAAVSAWIAAMPGEC